MIRGIIILHLLCFCFAAEVTSSVSLKTGKKLAVLKFEGWDSEWSNLFPLTGGPFLNIEPNRNIKIDQEINSKGFVELFEKKCPPC